MADQDRLSGQRWIEGVVRIDLATNDVEFLWSATADGQQQLRVSQRGAQLGLPLCMSDSELANYLTDAATKTALRRRAFAWATKVQGLLE